MAHYKVPGIGLALIERGEIAWTGGYGVREAGGDALVTGDTLFQAASISKPVTAMGALRLVQEGVLDLDADVNDMLSAWQVPDPEGEYTRERKVTLRGLLSHTAGLGVPTYFGYPAGADVPTVPQVLAGEPPASSEPVRVVQEPGSGYRYSAGGYTVVGQLLEDVTGKPFADLMRELVFDKLGMRRSTFAQPLPEAMAAGAATAHRSNGEPVPGRWHTYPELGTAGLWSTPSDLARFVVEILKSEAGESNVVLSFKMTRQMLTPVVWVGLGPAIIEMEGWTRFEHPGWNEGYHCYMGGWIGTGQGVVWMTNGENGKMLGLEVMRGLARVYGWPGFEPEARVVAPIDPALYARYEGRYRYSEWPDYGAVVVREGDRFFWEDTPGGVRVELFPESETAFFSLERPERITFVQGDDDDVETVTFGPYERLERVD
jgi:CubicO group peptidase (beta-lactamase class C family)